MRAVVRSLLLLPGLAWAQDFTDPDDLSLGPLPQKKGEVPPEVPPEDAPVEGEAPLAVPVEPAVPPVAAEAPATVTEALPGEPPKLWRNTIAVGAAGGYEFASAQPWVGLELAVHHDGTKGFAPIARVSSGYGFADQRPLFKAEAGFLGVTRSRQGLVRIGLLGGTVVQITDLPTPLQVGEPVEGSVGQPAFLPYGQIVAEVGGQRATAQKGVLAWAAGLRLGAGAAVGNVLCEEAVEGCVAVRAGFIGGIYGRVRFHEGVFLEVLAGPSAGLSIGYALTPKWGL